MNSAMMPRPGTYTCARISAKEFYNYLTWAHKRGILKSYIGYPQNLQIIQRETGISLPLSREATRIDDGDSILVMKLKYYRDGVKGLEIDPNALEFFYVTYKSF